jgi:hypothetical protein
MAFYYLAHKQPIPYDIALLAQVRGEWRDGLLWAHVPPVKKREPRTKSRPPLNKSALLDRNQTRYIVSNTSTRRCSVAASKPLFTAISRPLLSTTDKARSALGFLPPNSTATSPSLFALRPAAARIRSK